MNHPTTGTDPTGQADASGHADASDTGERLREAFAEAAYTFTPQPVPLEAIERDGRRRRRRRRATALTTGCGLLLIPLAVLAFRPDGPSSSVRPMAPPTTSHSATPSPSITRAPLAGRVRIVTPGERVSVEDGTKIWLTEKGKHWIEPEPEPGVPEFTQFRSVVDGNLDTSEPGVSLQESTSGGGSFLSGLYYGGRTEANGVEIELRDGEKIDGTVLRLSGNTEWGVWYAYTKVPEDLSVSGPRGITRRVTVYDATGGVVASMDFDP